MLSVEIVEVLRELYPQGWWEWRYGSLRPLDGYQFLEKGGVGRLLGVHLEVIVVFEREAAGLKDVLR